MKESWPVALVVEHLEAEDLRLRRHARHVQAALRRRRVTLASRPRWWRRHACRGRCLSLVFQSAVPMVRATGRPGTVQSHDRCDVVVLLEMRVVAAYAGVEHRPADLRPGRAVAEIRGTRLHGVGGIVDQRALRHVLPDALDVEVERNRVRSRLHLLARQAGRRRNGACARAERRDCRAAAQPSPRSRR